MSSKTLYTGVTIFEQDRRIEINTSLFCASWEEVDGGEIEEHEFTDMMLFNFLDYEGFIEEVVFIDSPLNSIFERDVVLGMFDAMARRLIRPLRVKLELLNGGEIEISHLRRLLEFNRYLKWWTFEFNRDDLEPLQDMLKSLKLDPSCHLTLKCTGTAS